MFKDKETKREDLELPNEPTMAQVMARLADIAAANNRVQSQQLKQTAPKSNTRGPATSPYNPRGQKDYPMPELKCMHMMPFEQKPSLHGLDREEVELINLLRPGKYTIEMNDGALKTVVLNGKINRITGDVESIRWEGEPDPDSGHPSPLFTGHNKQEFPSLRVIMRQMLGQKSAFRDSDNGDTYGIEPSPADDVMPMKIELRRVQEWLKLKPEERELLEHATVQHPTAAHKGPLAVSVGE